MSLRVAAEHFDRFLAVFGEVNGCAPVVQHFADDEPIRAIVLGDEDAEIFERSCVGFGGGIADGRPQQPFQLCEQNRSRQSGAGVESFADPCNVRGVDVGIRLHTRFVEYHVVVFGQSVGVEIVDVFEHDEFMHPTTHDETDRARQFRVVGNQEHATRTVDACCGAGRRPRARISKT